jgi:hypothetical protein
MKIHWLPLVALAAALALGGCSKSEEPKPEAAKAAAPAAQPEMPASHPPVAGAESGSGMAASQPRQVVVPDDVKATWKAVVLSVTDKQTNESHDVTVDIGGTAKDGDLEITVEDFLPAFSMGGGTITSSANETLNPAARLVVKDKGAEIFTGWLFSLYPDAHPFQHDKYSVILKDFVKK